MEATTAPTARLETLVAMDYNGGTDVAPLIARMGDAVTSWSSAEQPHWRDGERLITVHRIEFNAYQLRNTEAHGMGYRAGFVVHVETPGHAHNLR